MRSFALPAVMGAACLMFASANPVMVPSVSAITTQAPTTSALASSDAQATTVSRPRLGVLLIPQVSSTPSPTPTPTPTSTEYMYPFTSGTLVGGLQQKAQITDGSLAVPTGPPPSYGGDPVMPGGWTQLTYWSCRVWTSTTACGWHMPMVQVGGAVGCGMMASGEGAVLRAGVVAGAVVAGGLLIGV